MTTPINILSTIQPTETRKIGRGVSLSELIPASEGWGIGISEVQMRNEELKFTSEGLIYKGEVLHADQETRNRLFHKIDAPASYLETHPASLQADVLTEHGRRGDFGPWPVAITRHDELITIVPGALTTLSNHAVIKAVQEELGKEGADLMVAKIDRTMEGLELDLVSPSKSVDVRVGDIVQGGISIVHAPYGKQATRVQSFIFRLVCENGMTRRECVSTNGIARTRRLGLNYPNACELQTKQVQRLVRQSWNSLETQFGELQATSQRTTNVEELLTRFLQRARISVNDMLPKLRSAWIQEGAENTQWGAINALTRAATHDGKLSPRQRRTLASLAGLLAFSNVHLCERCWSVLTEAAAQRPAA